MLSDGALVCASAPIATTSRTCSGTLRSLSATRPDLSLTGSSWQYLGPEAVEETESVMIDVVTRLGDVKSRTAEALRASETDSGASAVLVAVVREFDSKADKANRQTGSEASTRDAVIELEQAGDSAKAAAEADLDVGPAAKQAVLDAHLAICVLKTEI